MRSFVSFRRAVHAGARWRGRGVGAPYLKGVMLSSVAPRRLFRFLVAMAGGLGSMIGLGAAASASASLRTSVTSYPGYLNAVSADSSSDAWAVGYALTSSAYKALILHWTGSSWVRVAVPSPGGASLLSGVSALTASDAWAVGYYRTSQGGNRTLVLHWNGARWSRVASPSPEVVDGSFLQSVSATSATNAWAAGWYYGPGGENSNTLVLHWNGVRWSRAPSASPAYRGFNYLYGVSAPSNGAAWAVGSDDHGTLVERWNGTGWVKAAAPNPSSVSSFAGVSATSRSNAWAVGSGPSHPLLVARWNGARWSAIPSPNPGTGGLLTSVSALRSSGAWAVGVYGPSETLPLIIHCINTRCRRTASPNPGGMTGTQLNGVSALSQSDAWAVGYTNPASSSSRTVILHWNGTRWTRS